MYRHCFLITLLGFTSPATAGEWNSSITGEWMTFIESPAFAGQHDNYLSGAVETEYFHEWNDGNDLFIFKPFYRVDQHDEERSHGDIRELSWLHAENDWELLVGISKVFWGATEAVHLVDIINQTDLVENQDGEDKLGQPMIKYTLIKDWGVLDLFVLPGFRERTFPSIEGRPRTSAYVDSDVVFYESSDKKEHVDYAARWSRTLDNWDVGISCFKGTSREPLLLPVGSITGAPSPLPVLGVSYDQIVQVGLDVQASIDAWLFKLEAITRHDQTMVAGIARNFSAAAAGTEYTFVGVHESQIDVGVIVEYLFDERELTTPFQNDIVLGARIALNDAESSDLLVSMIIDTEGDGQAFNIEGTSRINDNMKLSIEARGVTNLEQGSLFSSFEKDNRIRTELTYYF